MEPEPKIHLSNGAKTIRQKQISIVLFTLLAVIYFGFYIFAIVSPNDLAQPTFNAVPLSFLLGGIIIISSVVITFIYAFFANLIDDKEGTEI